MVPSRRIDLAYVAKQEVSVHLGPVQGIDNTIAQIANQLQGLVVIVEGESPVLEAANKRWQGARDERPVDDLTVRLIMFDALIEVERPRIGECMPSDSGPFCVSLVVLRWKSKVLRSQRGIGRCQDCTHEARAGVHDGARWLVSIRRIVDLDAIVGAGVIDQGPGAEEEFICAEAHHGCGTGLSSERSSSIEK